MTRAPSVSSVPSTADSSAPSRVATCSPRCERPSRSGGTSGCTRRTPRPVRCPWRPSTAGSHPSPSPAAPRSVCGRSAWSRSRRPTAAAASPGRFSKGSCGLRHPPEWPSPGSRCPRRRSTVATASVQRFRWRATRSTPDVRAGADRLRPAPSSTSIARRSPPTSVRCTSAPAAEHRDRFPAGKVDGRGTQESRPPRIATRPAACATATRTVRCAG